MTSLSSITILEIVSVSEDRKTLTIKGIPYGSYDADMFEFHRESGWTDADIAHIRRLVGRKPEYDY